MQFLTSIVILCSLLAVSTADEIEKDEGVLVLTVDNFKDAIQNNEFMLVEFYAPWCGHCKALAPEYAKAAQELNEKGSNVLLGKVDATEHGSLAEEFGVRGYPTLKFFRNGTPIDYAGGRNTEGIISWVSKKTGPAAKTVSNKEEHDKFIKEASVTIVGFFKDLESEHAKTFEKAAQGIDDFPFAITSDEALLKEYEVSEFGVLLFKDFDEGKAVFEDEFTTENLLAFVSGNSLATVVDFNHETASKIFGGEIKSHMLIFISKEAGHYDDYLEIAKTVAKKFKGKLLFVTINTDEEDHARILEFFGMSKEEIPGLRIIKLEEDMAKYKPPTYDITEEALSTFVEAFLDGKLKQHLLAQDLPEDWDKTSVLTLVSSNFEEVVMDKSKDVLVEFYAPWCGHCKQLAPIFDELGDKFKDSETVVIAKMDSTANELEGIKIQSFPTLKLFQKETNEVVDYSGARTLDAMVDFLEGKKVDDDESGEDLDEDEDEPLGKDEL